MVKSLRANRETVMDLVLNRNSHKAAYTDGVMTIPDGERLYSIEQPWRDNQKRVSCVPPGRYDLIPYMSPTHGATWYLENLDLGVGGAGADRSYCEIHAANWARQLEGCIAFGTSHFPLLDSETNTVAPAVENSANAIELLKAALGVMSPGHTLTII